VKSTVRQIKQTLMLVKQIKSMKHEQGKISLVCTQQNKKSFLILR